MVRLHHPRPRTPLIFSYYRFVGRRRRQRLRSRRSHRHAGQHLRRRRRASSELKAGHVQAEQHHFQQPTHHRAGGRQPARPARLGPARRSPRGRTGRCCGGGGTCDDEEASSAAAKNAPSTTTEHEKNRINEHEPTGDAAEDSSTSVPFSTCAIIAAPAGPATTNSSQVLKQSRALQATRTTTTADVPRTEPRIPHHRPRRRCRPRRRSPRLDRAASAIKKPSP